MRIEKVKMYNVEDIIKKLKNKEIMVQDLTDLQKKDVYSFLQKHILKKRMELNIKKDKVLHYKVGYEMNIFKRI